MGAVFATIYLTAILCYFASVAKTLWHLWRGEADVQVLQEAYPRQTLGRGKGPAGKKAAPFPSLVMEPGSPYTELMEGRLR
ncbi:MAG: hypothetical protein QJR00_01790 [Bacillota bacterium]|nr:hypothetical protein [Bacillota bacterium]